MSLSTWRLWALGSHSRRHSNRGRPTIQGNHGQQASSLGRGYKSKDSKGWNVAVDVNLEQRSEPRQNVGELVIGIGVDENGNAKCSRRMVRRATPNVMDITVQ